MGWGDGEKWDATYEYFDRAWGNVLSNLQKRFVDYAVSDAVTDLHQKHGFVPYQE